MGVLCILFSPVLPSPLEERYVGDQGKHQNDSVLNIDFVKAEASKKLDAEVGGEDESRHSLADDPDLGQELHLDVEGHQGIVLVEASPVGFKNLLVLRIVFHWSINLSVKIQSVILYLRDIYLAPDQHCEYGGECVGEDGELGDDVEADLEKAEGEEAGDDGLVAPGEHPGEAEDDGAHAGDEEEEVGGLGEGAVLVVQHAREVEIGKVAATWTKPQCDVQEHCLNEHLQICSSVIVRSLKLCHLQQRLNNRLDRIDDPLVFLVSLLSIFFNFDQSVFLHLKVAGPPTDADAD